MFPSYTSNSRAKQILPFWFFIEGVLWFTPLWILILVFEVSMWRSGEILPLRLVARYQAQNESKIVFMRRYFDQGLYRLKYLSIQQQRPDVLILGTSRVMQIRREMFGMDRREVYNAGGMIQHLRDLGEFTASLDSSYYPRVVIIGVEPWWFNQKWAEMAEKDKHFLSMMFQDGSQDVFAHSAVFQSFIRSLFLGSGERQIIEDVFSGWQGSSNRGSLFLGFAALDKKTGFRPDGSLDYGHSVLPRSDWEFTDREAPPIIERIRLRKQGFEPVAGLSSASVDKLRINLKRLRSKGIMVICFAPPFSSESISAIENISDLNKFWHEYLTIIPILVNEEGGTYLDVSRPEKVGMDDRSMVDGMHAMETFHVALLKKMAEDPELRRILRLNQDRLIQILANKFSNFWFPKYQ